MAANAPTGPAPIITYFSRGEGDEWAEFVSIKEYDDSVVLISS